MDRVGLRARRTPLPDRHGHAGHVAVEVEGKQGQLSQEAPGVGARPSCKYLANLFLLHRLIFATCQYEPFYDSSQMYRTS